MNQLLTVRSRFSFVDLAGVSPQPFTPKPTKKVLPPPEEIDRWRDDPESFLPQYPEEIQHQDLTSLLFDFYRARLVLRHPEALAYIHQWEGPPRNDSMWLRKKIMKGMTEEEILLRRSTTVHLRVGLLPCSVSYPANLLTLTCFDCSRPLPLFHLTVLEEEAPLHGWCPMCLLRKEWRKEVGTMQAEARSSNQKVPTEAQALSLIEQNYLSNWRKSDAVWWDEQKAHQSSLYSKWRKKMLSKLQSKFGTES